MGRLPSRFFPLQVGTAMKSWLFVVCLSFFLGHELDAVSQAEWRLLYGFRDLPSHVAEPWFVLLHVPLLAVVLGLCWHRRRAIRAYSRLLLAGFTLVHAGLHYHLRDHPLSTFDSPSSQALIAGSALLGALYCLACLCARPLDPTRRRRGDPA